MLYVMTMADGCVGCGCAFQVFFLDISVSRVYWISLMDIEEWTLSNTSTDVWLCTFYYVADCCCGIAPHHMTIMTPFQVGTVLAL